MATGLGRVEGEEKGSFVFFTLIDPDSGEWKVGGGITPGKREMEEESFLVLGSDLLCTRFDTISHCPWALFHCGSKPNLTPIRSR